MAVVSGCTYDGISTYTGTGSACLGLCAGIAIVAGCSISAEWVGAQAGGRVAGAGVVALVEGGADDVICAHAAARNAGVTLRAEVIVAA